MNIEKEFHLHINFDLEQDGANTASKRIQRVLTSNECELIATHEDFGEQQLCFRMTGGMEKMIKLIDEALHVAKLASVKASAYSYLHKPSAEVDFSNAVSADQFMEFLSNLTAPYAGIKVNKSKSNPDAFKIEFSTTKDRNTFCTDYQQQAVAYLKNGKKDALVTTDWENISALEKNNYAVEHKRKVM